MKRKLFQGRLTRWGIAIAILASAIAPTSLKAQTPPQPNCSNPATTIEINFCTRFAYEEADRQLNEIYQYVIANLSRSSREKLIDAQLRWIQFRDKNCIFEVDRNQGGSGYNGFLNSCLERMTRQRIAELQEYTRSW